jgi:hypothetical protein
VIVINWEKKREEVNEKKIKEREWERRRGRKENPVKEKRLTAVKVPQPILALVLQ